MAGIGQVCGVIDALSDFQQKIIDAINSKFAALRRLAEMLERLGDLTGFLPDLSKLVPISSLSLSIYENLRSSCPMLGLPPGQGSPAQVLGNLQAQVDAAYGSLLAQLDLNPLSRLSKLQTKLDGYQQQFNLSVLGGGDFMRCLQAACQATVAVAGTVSNLSKTTPAQVTKSATTYLDNMVTKQGKILTAAQEAKVSDWSATRDALNKLRDVPAIDLPVLPSK
jgi:hypothetical protein